MTKCRQGSRVLAVLNPLACVMSDCLSSSVHVSDSPHCEPPLVEEPAPDTVSVSHNSEDGA